jgi:hypothetical protein
MTRNTAKSLQAVPSMTAPRTGPGFRPLFGEIRSWNSSKSKCLFTLAILHPEGFKDVVQTFHQLKPLMALVICPMMTIHMQDKWIITASTDDSRFTPFNVA